MDYFEKLNTAQRDAVVSTEGPVMILAGAGSGKTRTLVSRISYLINQLNLSPYQILALTFSNKAAKEMRERISMEIKAQAGALQVVTFHSFCAYVLRTEYSLLGLSRNFSIYDKSESKSIVKNILNKRGISNKALPPLAVLYYIDDLKNKGFYSGRVENRKGNDFFSASYSDFNKDEEYFEYFQEYEQELRRSNAIDFGGLITGVLQLFENYPQVLERYQQKFKYILVDEYQDTNRAQFDLVLNLCERHRNLCVVGDEDQSIYSWRGADIRNILEYDKIFPDVKVIKLEQNYRSSKTIIEAATYVISKNMARKGKEMWTDNPEGDHVEIVECFNDKAESEFVAKEVKKLKRAEVGYKDMAVFYRGNAQSRLLEECLLRENIPYRVIGGTKFYERKEIKDLLGYLRLVVNNKDSLSLTRIINAPARGIGTTTLRKLEGEAVKNQTSLWDIITGLILDPQKYSYLKISGKVKSSLAEFVNMVQNAIDLNRERALPSLIYEKILHESGYLENLKASKDYESLGRIDNLEELLNAIKQFEQHTINPSLVGFLESVTLDSYSDQDLVEEQGELSLMTVHGAKGLEFPYVFLVGAEENIFPSYKSLESSEMAIEEERRLFYVAMTRAMKKLTICFSQGRMLHGKLVFNGPSRFIMEIPQNLYKWVQLEKNYQNDSWSSSSKAKDARPSSSSSSSISKKSDTFPKGSKIVHALYGEGLVLETDGMGNEEKILIRFNGGVIKRFMVKYTPISLQIE